MAGTKAFETRNMLRRLAAMSSSNSSVVISRNERPTNRPVLLMRTSARPTAFAAAATDSSLVASHTTTRERAPSLSQAAATRLWFFSLRASRARLTPRTSRANSRAMAAPFPCEAPVMTTTGVGMGREGRAGTPIPAEKATHHGRRGSESPPYLPNPCHHP
jgi:hypothetical protein